MLCVGLLCAHDLLRSPSTSCRSFVEPGTFLVIQKISYTALIIEVQDPPKGVIRGCRIDC